MKTHYELQSTTPYNQPLVFDWDIETGEISGPDAQQIISFASAGSIGVHPTPWVWTFSNTPLKNKTDMAAILSFEHELPADLADFHPQWPGNGAPDISYTDADGVFVVGHDLLLY